MAIIFISYRRQDSEIISGRIYDWLSREFGRGGEVFKDVNHIPPGVDFRKHLAEVVGTCRLLIAIIGDKWLNATDEESQRRLDHPDDFVRIEIEAALQRNIPVFPVLIANTVMPKKKDLPKSLEELAYRSALRLRNDPDFERDMGMMIEALKAELKRLDRQPAAPGTTARGGTGQPKVPPPHATALPGEHEGSVRPEDRWQLTREIRRPVLDLIGPTYVLDTSYHFLDWNPAFEELVAKPLRLRRGQHARLHRVDAQRRRGDRPRQADL